MLFINFANVGMSTTHEATMARYCGLNVLAFSIVTDMVCMKHDSEEPDVNHEEVVKVANLKSQDALRMFSQFMKKLHSKQELL
jgi:purine nucleoside phosphorylase